MSKRKRGPPTALSEALEKAIKSRNVQKVHELLKEGADPNLPFSNGWTPLIASESDFSSQVTQLLIDYGANVNAMDEIETTPLQFAVCVTYDVDLIKLLVDNGADIHHALFLKEAGKTIMHFVGMCGNLELAKLFIEYGVDINKRGNDGWLALHHACESSDLEVEHHIMVKLLIENGSDFDVQTNEGKTPLHLACEYGRLKVVQLLLSLGANSNTKTREGSITPLHAACNFGNYEIVKLLIDNGADLRAKDDDGKTALHIACDKEMYFALAKLLIERGADVNAKDKDGNTPLHLVLSCNGDEEGDGNADSDGFSSYGDGTDEDFYFDDEDEDGHAPSFHPVQRSGNDDGDNDDMEPQDNHDEDSNSSEDDSEDDSESSSDSDSDEEGLYFEVKESLYCGLIKLLVDNGADLNAKNKLGMTPLFYACENGGLEVVQLLLSRGANANVATTQGSTPLIVASQANHQEVVWFLVRQCPSLIL